TLTLNGAGAITVEASQSGDSKFDPAAVVTQTIVVSKVPITLTWPTPDDVVAGTVLDTVQLNATASPNVPGTFAYTPTAGTVLDPNDSLQLSVTFNPTDSANYATVVANTNI